MKRKLSLSAKFNLVFLIVFAIGLSAAGVVADRLLQKQALDETVHDANVLISAAASMQSYTATHVTPLLATQIKYQFVPESIPAFSAIEMLNLLDRHDHDIDYAYTSQVTPTSAARFQDVFHPVEPFQVRAGLSAQF